MKTSKLLILVIPIVVFVVFVLLMLVWLSKKTPDTNNISIDTITPTPTTMAAPTVADRKTTSLINQINAFDPLDTTFAPPVFERLLDLPKE